MWAAEGESAAHFFLRGCQLELTLRDTPGFGRLSPMPPLVDIHVHLLAGLDDGPRTPEDAVAMCRMMTEEGIRYAAAGAHQNDEYPNNTPDKLRTAAGELAERLRAADIPLETKPSAEVMVSTETLDQLQRKDLLTIGDTGRYILIEMPHGLCVELKWLVEELVDRGYAE